MLGLIFVWALFAFLCVAPIFRPHIGILGYYGFVLLQPAWNWRWSISPDFPFQKYITAATLLGLVVTGFRGNRLTRTSFSACASLVVFLGIAFVSAQSTIAPRATEFYMSNLWKMIFMVVVAIFLLDSPKKIIACMWVLMLAQGYNAMRINEDYFEMGFCAYVRRPWGFSGDNNLYSILTVPIIAVSLSLAVYSPKKWQKAIAWVVFLLQSHQIMLMESRGCMLGCLPMLALFIWLVPKTRLRWRTIAIAFFCVASLAGPPVIEEFTSSFESEENLDSSASSRYKLWQAGFNITMDYPLLGVGPYAGQYLVAKYYPGGLPDGALGNKGLHNLFFEISTGCGIPALIAYVGYFFLSWLQAVGMQLRQRRESIPDWAACVSLAVTTGTVGYWCSSMFSSGALLESSYICPGLAAASASVLLQRNRWQQTPGSSVSANLTTDQNTSPLPENAAYS